MSSNNVFAQSKAEATGTSQNGPLVIARQGSFFVGGTALTGSFPISAGRSDHLRVWSREVFRGCAITPESEGAFYASWRRMKSMTIDAIPITFLIAQAAGRDFLEQYPTRLIVRLDLCIKGIRYAECLLDGALRPTLAMILLG